MGTEIVALPIRAHDDVVPFPPLDERDQPKTRAGAFLFSEQLREAVVPSLLSPSDGSKDGGLCSGNQTRRLKTNPGQRTSPNLANPTAELSRPLPSEPHFTTEIEGLRTSFDPFLVFTCPHRGKRTKGTYGRTCESPEVKLANNALDGFYFDANGGRSHPAILCPQG